jgi:hypothetical protein
VALERVEAAEEAELDHPVFKPSFHDLMNTTSFRRAGPPKNKILGKQKKQKTG